MRCQESRKLIVVPLRPLALGLLVSIAIPRQYQFEYVSSDGAFFIIEMTGKDIVDYGPTGKRSERRLDLSVAYGEGDTSGGTFGVVQARYSEYVAGLDDSAPRLMRITKRDWANVLDWPDNFTHPRWSLPVGVRPTDPFGRPGQLTR